MSNIKKITTIGLTLTMVVGMLPGVASAYSSKSGWVLNEETGKWSYYEDGRKIKCDIRYDSSTNKSYLLDTSGNRVTKKGWVTLKYYYTYYGDKINKSKKYYLKTDGAALDNGFHKIGKKTLYFYKGALVKNDIVFPTNKDGITTACYYVGKDGAKVTKKGWRHLKGTAYDGWSGMSYKRDVWIYINKGGKLATGLKKIGGKKYVFNSSGHMVTDSAGGKLNGNTYYLADKNGVQVTKKGWHKISWTTKYKNSDVSGTIKQTNWYYVKSDGTLQMGLKKIKGKYYYFSPEMAYAYSYRKPGDEYDTIYYFGKTGECKKTKKVYHNT